VIYLIGCDHKAAQTYHEGTALDNPQNKMQKAFRELLIKATEKHEPSLIAEEQNEEGLKSNSLCSVAREVASEMGIQHRLCEQSIEAKIIRGLNGIPSVSSSDRREAMYKYFLREWPIREEFWISQLRDDIHERVLFICGAGHRETLRRRLERGSIEVKIIAKRFGVSNLWYGDFPAYKAAYRDLRRTGFVPVP
jgi:hypothetical protein